MAHICACRGIPVKDKADGRVNNVLVGDWSLGKADIDGGLLYLILQDGPVVLQGSWLVRQLGVVIAVKLVADRVLVVEPHKAPLEERLAVPDHGFVIFGQPRRLNEGYETMDEGCVQCLWPL